ncbi:MAG: cation-translocating P-type ATPase [Candidatus Lokiarchaeota archaeon]|nr:cation-translocating P-type ATPase [Candidatus Lokiarchaeota archaeon]
MTVINEIKKVDWHSLEISEVFKDLNTTPRGLSIKEVENRLISHGFNELKGSKKISPLKVFLNQFKSILILILIVATIISFVTGHEIDAIVILILVFVSTVIGFVQEYRAEKALEALKKMLSPIAVVMRDGKELEILVREIVPGDIIVLKEGDKVPADSRLIEVNNLQTNEASLTGESLPIRKVTMKLAKFIALLERKNMVFSGTVVNSGKGKAVVIATGMNTEFGKIAERVLTLEKTQTPLELRTKELGKWMGIIALSISAAVFIFGLIRGFPFLTILLFSIALSVAAVPEALPAVVTGSLAIGMRKMAKENALVRRMSAVETLGSTTVICSDKTGTLTKGEMTVRKLYFSDMEIEISGVGYEPKGSFQLEGNMDLIKNKNFELFMNGAVLCNDAELINEGNVWRIRGDPTEGALIVVATKLGFSQENLRELFSRVAEIPFSSERKRMTTSHSSGSQTQVIFMKGAPEIVLQRCSFIAELDYIEKLTKEKVDSIISANEKMTNQALRVLALASKKIESSEIQNDENDEKLLENDLIFLGLVGMIDPPRSEVIQAVEICKQVEIKTVMITGDHKSTALAIAKEIGIYHEGDLVLTGEDLEKISDEQLETDVEKISVYARVSPLHKLKIVKAWKSKGHVVAMTGDGVNDAPALKQASIGIAMGITGTEVTKETADLVLTDDNFATIVNAIETGRWIYDNIKKFLTYLLQANLVEIIILSTTILLGFPLPLIAIQILFVNLATDGLPALALGLSPPDPDIMKRPPRPPRETIFTKDIKSFLLRALIFEVPLLLWIFIGSLGEGTIVARTRLFLVFIFFELVVALSCRSLKYNILKVKPHRTLLLVVLGEVIFTVILFSIPAVREAFGIGGIGLIEILLVIFMSFVVLISIELTKRLLNILIERKLKK